MQRGTFQLMKSVNKSIVLNTIRIKEQISRAQIAKDTSLTPPTVSSIVRELMEEGLVVESTLGNSSGGRKPTLLHINRELYVIGVDAGPETIDCAITDVTGRIITRISNILAKNISKEDFLALLVSSIQSVVNHKHINTSKIIGIGVAMHGVVDVDTGTSLIAPNLHLQDIPIKSRLEEVFPYMVKVENDARAMALGEAWFGEHSDTDSMMAINFGNGVGAGIVIKGELLHGAQDIAGEVGHMTIDLNGDMCSCGNRGCFQSYASGPAIASRFSNRFHTKETLTAADIYEQAIDGEKQAVDHLENTGEIMGIAIVNVIHTLNPERVVLGGGVMKSKQFILPSLIQTVEKRVLTERAKNTQIVVSELGDDATMYGAASLVLVELFDQQA